MSELPFITGPSRVFVDGKEVADVREVEIVAGARPTAVIVDELSPQADEYLEPCRACMTGGVSTGVELSALAPRDKQVLKHVATDEEMRRVVRRMPKCRTCRGRLVITKSIAIDVLNAEIDTLKDQLRAARERGDRLEGELEDSWADRDVQEVREAGRRLLEELRDVLPDRFEDVRRGILTMAEVEQGVRDFLFRWERDVPKSDEIRY